MMRQITLEQMLQARERRAMAQRRLLKQYGLPLISFTLNIPGPVKRDDQIQWAFQQGMSLLRQRFDPVYIEDNTSDAGCESLLVVRGSGAAIKRITVSLEDVDALGRLFDMDVLDGDGRPVSRAEMGLPQRRCLLCDGPAHACARSRAHGVEALFERVQRIILEHMHVQWAREVASHAQRALLYEVSITPKPGLVDRADNGAHQDMDFFTFMASISSLYPYLQACALLGCESSADTPQALFDRLQEQGRRAEEAMLRATRGVNTHKGAIFIMCLFCGAAGRLGRQQSMEQPLQVLALCGEMTRVAVDDYFAKLTWDTANTAGDRLFLRYGLRGVRGEAAKGFPSVRDVGLVALQEALARGLTRNEAAIWALLRLISQVPDTALINRCSYEAWLDLKRMLKQQLAQQGDPALLAKQLNPLFVQRHLSAGGCADLLALTLLIHEMQMAR